MGEALVERDGVNGLDAVSTVVWAAPADSGTWPDHPSNCLGAGAETAFAALPAGSSATDIYFVQMPDPWTVESVSNRYMNLLNPSTRLWSANDCDTARNDWSYDRENATAAATAALASDISTIPGCSLLTAHGLFPYATVECTTAGAETLWTSAAVACLEIDSGGFVYNDTTGQQTVQGHGLRAFLPVARGSAVSMTGYTDGRSSHEVVILEASVPDSATLDHLGFGFGASSGTPWLSRVDSIAEGCRNDWISGADCKPSWANVDPGWSHPGLVGTTLMGDITDDQDPAFPTSTSPWSDLEDRSGVARGVSARFQSLGN